MKTSPHASQYPGVRWHKATQKWEAYIRVAGRKLHLGLFVEEADAADAHLRAADAHLRAAERDERGEPPR